MPNFFSPFILAIILHIFIVVSAGLLNEKTSDNLISQSKNIINVNFSGSGNTGGRVGDKIVKQLKSSSTEIKQVNGPALELNLGSTVNGNEAIGTGNGSGTGAASGEGSGLGSGISFGDAVTSFKEPAYPRLALRRGIEGSLKIKIVISPEGFPQEIIVLTSSGHEILDKAAIEAVRVWKFTSQAKSYFVLKTIVFQIKN